MHRRPSRRAPRSARRPRACGPAPSAAGNAPSAGRCRSARSACSPPSCGRSSPSPSRRRRPRFPPARARSTDRKRRRRPTRPGRSCRAARDHPSRAVRRAGNARRGPIAWHSARACRARTGARGRGSSSALRSGSWSGFGHAAARDSDRSAAPGGVVRLRVPAPEVRMELIDRTVTDLVAALDRGEARSLDLAEACIARTAGAAGLNCCVEFDAEGLRRQARDADAQRAAGDRRPLLGVPIALKDNIQALGFACGNGTPALHGRHPATDAELVRRLRAAGALIAGKLGMHELALGITNHNPVTGAVRNPWDPKRMPGGSSGGSGAAVAARLVPAAVGTDTGGSVRIPAALCGVAGLRPSVGRVSGTGIAPISTTRDTAGPLARSVADLALLDEVLTGDAAPLPAVTLRGVRLGLPDELFWDDLDPGVRSRADAAIAVLRDAGLRIVPVALPGVGPLSGDVGFAVALFEFVRDMTAYLREQARGITFEQLIEGIASPDVKAIAGALAGDGAIPEPVYRQALAARRRLQALYAEAFRTSGVAALVFPTTPSTAAVIGDDERFMLNSSAHDTFATFIRNTDPGSNAGLPGLSLPIGLSAGLPVGLALDGPTGSDRRLLAVAAAIEAVLPEMPPCPWAPAAER